MPLFRHVQRHTIAAAAGVVGLTPGLFLLARSGLLGDLVPPGSPLRGAVLLALGLTVLLFVPAGIFFEWAVDKIRIPAAAAPFALALVFAAFWIGVEFAYNRFVARFIVFYLTLGAMVAVAFCAYWIPLRFLRRRIHA